IVVGEEIDLIGEEVHRRHTGHSHPHGNPHVWLDPVVAKAAVGLITGALCRVDPGREREYTDRAARYMTRLDSVVRVLTELTSRLGKRRFVSVHDSWPYFCRRFGFQAVAAIEPQPSREPSARRLAELVSVMKADSVSVIVVEPQHNRDLADMLARSTGATVVVLAPVTGALPEANSYIGMLDYNVRTLAAALSR
ncbi:MAG: metal ABC transporter substrate-binding protein, partial [candidate division WOR-3 bacterium]